MKTVDEIGAGMTRNQVQIELDGQGLCPCLGQSAMYLILRSSGSSQSSDHLKATTC